MLKVNLLEAKRSLNVNIFLRQFHSSASSSSPAQRVLEALQRGVESGLRNTPAPIHRDGPDALILTPPAAAAAAELIDGSLKLTIEMLTNLLKIFPDEDEMRSLLSYSGDSNRLGHAEKFLIELIALPT